MINSTLPCFCSMWDISHGSLLRILSYLQGILTVIQESNKKVRKIYSNIQICKGRERWINYTWLITSYFLVYWTKFNHHYPTAQSRVQITLKLSTNIMQYLDSWSFCTGKKPVWLVGCICYAQLSALVFRPDGKCA